ncbi:MAG: ACT domain-containing protein [Clostridia bacterium]|nr:ACT domain-containing protein [Clostridia bacterium]
MEQEMLLVSSAALPEVFQKVMQAKRLIASGEAKTATDASRMCGISRSAYYKYKDSVFEYSNSLGQTVSLQASLRDRAGVLSSFLQHLYSLNANLLTVNQGLPVNGIASFSVSFRISNEDFSASQMLNDLAALDGVVSVKQIHEK